MEPLITRVNGKVRTYFRRMHLRLSKLGALILAAVIALVAITNDTTVLLSILVGASIVTIISVTLILKGPAKLDKNEEKT